MAAQTRKRSTPTVGRSNNASLKQIISMLNHVSKDELDTVRAYLKSVKARSADEAVIMTSLPESGEGGDIVIRIPASEPRRQVITVKARKLQREQMPAKEDMHAEMERHFDEFRQELLANSWTTTKVAEHLNVTREAIRQRIAARQLFGIKFGKNLRFPKWQFTSRFPSGVLPGLTDVLKATVLDDIDLAAWFVAPQSALDNKTPVQALLNKQVNDVVAAAYGAGVT